MLIYLSAAYEPPFDYIKPIYKETLTPTNPRLICSEHGITFSTKFSSEMATKLHSSEQSLSMGKRKGIEVCVAVSMHINTRFPAEYTIVSPVCFVSCKCSHCDFSLTLPHAVDMANDSVHKDSFKILSMITFDVINFGSESALADPTLEKRLDEIAVKSIDIYEGKLKFKASMRSPSLFAVGIRNSPAVGVPRPLPVLTCSVFCMYEHYSENSSISHIPVKMYVGLGVESVRKVRCMYSCM